MRELQPVVGTWADTAPPAHRRRTFRGRRRRRLGVLELGDVLQLLDLRLDRVVVLGVSVQVHGDVEVLQGISVSLQLHVDLAQQKVHLRLLRGQTSHLFKSLQGFLEATKVDEHPRLLEVRHAIRRLALSRQLEVLQSMKRLVQGIENLAQVAAQHRIIPIDLQRLEEVMLGILVLLLAMVDVPKAEPGVVMARIDGQCVLVHGYGLVKLIVRGEFVAAQGVGIGESGVHLQRPPKELEGRVVLLLQREAVPNDTPHLRLHSVPLQDLLRKEAQLDILVQVPERRGVPLEALHPVGLGAPDLLEHLLGLLVVRGLEEAEPHEAQHVAGLVVPPRQCAQQREGLARLVAVHRVQGRAELGEELRQRDLATTLSAAFARSKGQSLGGRSTVLGIAPAADSDTRAAVLAHAPAVVSLVPRRRVLRPRGPTSGAKLRAWSLLLRAIRSKAGTWPRRPKEVCETLRELLIREGRRCHARG
mmetsp:Transcript_57174/g.185794  ORF Transcript_57174/g.185794 Transcript_57174/m.185794 type:complete len:475 (-) Transcript_57174:572-1996(-)